MKKIIPLLLLLTLSLSTQAEVTKEQQSAIDELFTEWNKPDSPGVALGVIQDGKLSYSNGYGLADLEHDVPSVLLWQYSFQPC